MSDSLSITTPMQGSPSRISWGSVIAGVVIAIAVMFTLGELCMAFGLSLLDPNDPSKDTSLPAIALTGAIAWIVSSLLSMFAGAWAAAHLARQFHDADGILHGLLVWGLGIVAFITIGAGASGAVIGGAFSLVNGGMRAVGTAAGGMAHGTGAMLGGIAQGVGSAVDVTGPGMGGMPGYSWESIKSRALALVQQGSEKMPAQSPAPATPATVPGAPVGANPATLPMAQDSASNSTASDPEEVMALVSRIFSTPVGTINDADRTALVGLLVANTSLSQEEAGKQVGNWERSAQKSKERYDAFKIEAEKNARMLAAGTAKLLSEAAWIAFLATVFAASAAIQGAHCGRRKNLVGVRTSSMEKVAL